MAETHTIHVWEMPCSCHCTKQQAAYCKVRKALENPEHPHHAEAKRVQEMVEGFPGHWVTAERDHFGVSSKAVWRPSVYDV